MTTKHKTDDAQTDIQKHAKTPMEAAGTTGSEAAADLNADMKAPLAPETHSVTEIANGLGKYKVKAGHKLSHNGKEYAEGEALELTGVDAESLQHILERAEEKK